MHMGRLRIKTSRSMPFLLAGLLSLFNISSCGDSQHIILDIDIAFNQFDQSSSLTSPFDELGANTLFITFEPMTATPTSINDVTGTGAIRFPSSGFITLDNSSVDISDANLDNDTFYRVTLFGTLDGGATTAKYASRTDCPLKKSLKDCNDVTLCFGLNSNSPTPNCTDLLPFANCPRTCDTSFGS